MTTDRHDNDQHKRERGPFVGCLAATLLFALLSYPLSWGPAVWLTRHGYLPNEAGVVYMPLAWIANHCEPFADLILWYVSFWVDL